MYTIMTTLVSAGWTVKSSSDGTTYNSSGNQITGGLSGANGLANSEAWFRIQAPLFGSVKRELIFQRSTSGDLNWRITYSPSAGFITGSPAATVVPSASDSVVILGGGTDASPSFSALFIANNTYRFHMMAGDNSIGYSFYCVGCPVGSQTQASSGIVFDVLQNGSYNSLDTDPCVISAAQNVSVFQNMAITYSAANGAFKGSLNGTSTILILSTLTGDTISIAPVINGSPGSAQNPFTLKDELFPCVYVRIANQPPPTGIKGISSFILAPSSVRNTLNTQTVATTRDRIILGYFSFPWNGSRVLQ